MPRINNARTPSARLFLRFAFIAVACLLAGCSKFEPIKIGFVDGLDGCATDLGQASRDGALLAVEHRNAKGGVNGRKIELVVKNDEQKSEVAIKVVRELIADGVVAIVGHGTSTMSAATAPIANEAKTLMMSHTSTSKELSNRYDYFFRVVNTTERYAVKNANFRRFNLKEKTIAAAYDMSNRAYSESWLEDFRTTFEKNGGKITTVVTFASGSRPSHAQIARQLLASKPDGILLIANSMHATLLAKEIRKINATVNLGTSEWAATEQLAEIGGDAVEGIYSSQFIERDSKKPAYVAFRSEYLQKFGKEPGYGGVAAYEATNIILDALVKKKDNENLREVILSTGTFSGLQGKIVFNSSRDADRPSYITTVIKGIFQTYEN